MSDKSAEGRRDPAVLRALLDRVQWAEGPDREIDADVMAACFGWAAHNPPYLMPPCPSEEPVYWHAPEWAFKREVPLLSSSLDASTALAERLLPGWRWKCGILEDGVCWCALYAKHHEPAEMGWAKTVPVAVLSTLLQALIANAEEGH